MCVCDCAQAVQEAVAVYTHPCCDEFFIIGMIVVLFLIFFAGPLSFSGYQVIQ
jgi:hypothetical protein